MQLHATIVEGTFVNKADPRSATKMRRRPIQKLLVSFSAAYFTGALVTDLAYWQTLNVLWERFSIWLIVAGLVLAGLAVVTHLSGLANRRQKDRAGRAGG